MKIFFGIAQTSTHSLPKDTMITHLKSYIYFLYLLVSKIKMKTDQLDPSFPTEFQDQ